MQRKILVTGAAGFIGYHTSLRLLSRGDLVVGFDNLNGHYDVSLKQARLRLLQQHQGFSFVHADLVDQEAVDETFRSYEIEEVVHLAAQVGVRASVDKPRSYVDSNVVGFLHVLESCRHHHIRHLVFASSSSVYGSNTKVPYSVHDPADHPISLYAATKRSNELMAHAYSHLFGLPTTGLRFFTVYGPWSRPDMAPILFARAIVEGRPIDVFNHGEMERDFTYVDDVVEGIVRTLDRVPSSAPEGDGDYPSPATSAAPYRVYNIGNSSPVRLMDMIEALEEALGRHAERNYLPMQEGDMRQTYADVEDLAQEVGYRPVTDLREGIRSFAEWFLKYYDIGS